MKSLRLRKLAVRCQMGQRMDEIDAIKMQYNLMNQKNYKSMMIEMSCPNQERFRKTECNLSRSKNISNLNMNVRRNVHSSKNKRTIQIRIPFDKAADRQKNRFQTINDTSRNAKQHHFFNDELRSTSFSFKSVFEPKRTCGSVKNFLQVLQKRTRTKTIQDSFQCFNNSLQNDLDLKKGFKGKKLSFYSPFCFHNYHKAIIAMNSPQKISSSQSTMRNKQEIHENLQKSFDQQRQKVRIKTTPSMLRKKIKVKCGQNGIVKFQNLKKIFCSINPEFESN